MTYLAGEETPGRRIAAMLRKLVLRPAALVLFFGCAAVVLAAFLTQSGLALVRDASRASEAIDQTGSIKARDPAKLERARPVRLKKLESAALSPAPDTGTATP